MNAITVSNISAYNGSNYILYWSEYATGRRCKSDWLRLTAIWINEVEVQNPASSLPKEVDPLISIFCFFLTGLCPISGALFFSTPYPFVFLFSSFDRHSVPAAQNHQYIFINYWLLLLMFTRAYFIGNARV